MLALRYTNEMKRNLKAVCKRGKNPRKLQTVVDLLQAEQALPVKYREHKLSGEYADHWECQKPLIF